MSPPYPHRQKGLNVAIPFRPGTGAWHLLIGSTGIKSEREEEWFVSTAVQNPAMGRRKSRRLRARARRAQEGGGQSAALPTELAVDWPPWPVRANPGGSDCVLSLALRARFCARR